MESRCGCGWKGSSAARGGRRCGLWGIRGERGFPNWVLGYLGVWVLFRGVHEVQCPSCGELFSVPVPPRAECPARLDYDCEVCCRPMLIMIDEEGQAQAVGTDDSYSG
jgi:hypothetical protein